MESKKVLVSVLLISFIIAQIQVEAENCPSIYAQNKYNVCRFYGESESVCAKLAGCTLVTGNKHPLTYNRRNDNVHNGDDLDSIKEYCKLGCSSSVCAKIAIELQTKNTEASQVEDGAIELCTNACAAFCAKGTARLTM